MPRRLPVIFLLLCILATAVSCGGGGGHASDDLEDLDAPIDTGTVPCVRRLDLIVFINPAIPSTQFESIETSLKDVPGVVAISLVDQQAAYDEIARLFPDTPGLGTLDPSNLPASFRVTLDDPAHAADVRTVAMTIDGVGDVQLAKDSPQSASPTIRC